MSLDSILYFCLESFDFLLLLALPPLLLLHVIFQIRWYHVQDTGESTYDATVFLFVPCYAILLSWFLRWLTRFSFFFVLAWRLTMVVWEPTFNHPGFCSSDLPSVLTFLCTLSAFVVTVYFVYGLHFWYRNSYVRVPFFFLSFGFPQCWHSWPASFGS